jgi:hypothetical protein
MDGRDSGQLGIIEQYKRYYTLIDPTLRRIVIIALPILTVALLIVSGTGAFPPSVGLIFGLTGTLLLLGVLVEHVTDVISKDNQPEVQVFAQEAEEAVRRQQELISDMRLKSVKLCEFSSYTAIQYLSHLRACDNTDSVQLLVCDPRQVSEDQRSRTYNAIHNLSLEINQSAAQRMGLKIKCYSREHAALRGRNYDNQFVVLGWYTFHRKPNVRPDPRLYGAHNPVLIALCNNPYGGTLRETFDEIFDSLWQDAIPLQSGLTEAGEVKKQLPSGWLNEVS